MSPPATQLEAIDEMIRKGQVVTARRELRELAAKKVARSQAARFGLLAWRAKLGRLGIKALNPIVRPPPRSKVFADEEEKAAYAACLIQVGAIDEGLDILNSLDTKGLPQVLLLRVSALVARWEYREAIPLLLEYIGSPLVDDYQKLVGCVNLASAYIYEHQNRAAAELLPGIIESAASKSLNLLYCNALSLAAMNHIQGQEWTSAETALKQAAEGLGSQGGLDAFFVRKWNVVLRLLRDGADSEVLDELHAIRAEAVLLDHHETVRDCDHYRAIGTKDEKLFAHVWCGTPYPNYRAKLLEEFPGKEPPREYLWLPGGEGASDGHFDLVTGEDSRGKVDLKIGDASLRLIGVLSADFYRPLRTAALHARLYPGEYYNPVSSPLRVRQAIARLRRLAGQGLPLSVEESGGMYRLGAAAGYGVKLSFGEGAPCGSRLEWQVRLLRERWPQSDFSAVQAAEALGKSARSVRRVLERALSEGLLKRVGKGAATRYSFAAELSQKAA